MKLIYLMLLLSFSADSPNAWTERSPQGETQITHLLKVSNSCYNWNIEWIQIEQKGEQVQLQYRDQVNLRRDFFAAAVNESAKAQWIQSILIGTAHTIVDERLSVQKIKAKSRMELPLNDWEKIISLPKSTPSKLILGSDVVWVKLNHNGLNISQENDYLNFDALKRELLAR